MQVAEPAASSRKNQAPRSRAVRHRAATPA